MTASVYNQHMYDTEARQAIEAWADYVASLTDPKPAEVPAPAEEGAEVPA